jgi:hypothetical protein
MVLEVVTWILQDMLVGATWVLHMLVGMATWSVGSVASWWNCLMLVLSY